VNEQPPPRSYAFFRWWISVVDRHAKKLLLLLVATFALTGYLAFGMVKNLHSDFTELLPENHPAVVALRGISGKQRSATNLVVLIHSPDRAANNKLIEGMRPELAKLVPELFTEIQWKPNTDTPEFAIKWKWLFAEMKDLEHAESLLDRLVTNRGSPFGVDLEGDPEVELKKLREDLNRKLPPAPPPAKYFENIQDGEHWLGVMLWRRRDGLATRGDQETLKVVQEIVAKAEPTKIHPQLKVVYTGHLAQALDEQSGIKDDLTWATLVCAGLVLLVIALYFRRVAVLGVVFLPAVLGLAMALTLGAYTIKYLNLNTAFLIAIILGNGINFPIILMASYGDERRAERSVAEALARAFAATASGTVTAMAAASIAYGCLLLTSFNGFNQFGLIGGAGMLFAWIAMFLLVPPLVILGERLKPGLMTPRKNWLRRPFAWLGRMADRKPAALGLVVLILLGASARPLWSYMKDPLEWNFNNLRTDETPSQNNWGRMESLGMGDVGAGYVGNDGVFLVDKPEQADIVADAVRKKDAALGPKHVLKNVRTVNSLLPKEMPEKLDLLARVRRKIDKHVDMMDDDERKEVQAWRPPEYLRILTADDLPKQVQDAFTEVNGPRGRFIGVDADNETYFSWNGRDLLRIAKALTVEVEGRTWVAASAATIFAGILETIIQDGPRVTLAALIGVSLLILLMFGLRGALPVLLSVAIGVVWLGAWLGRFDMKINFMNFVALPITLGIGADYAANIWGRLRAKDRPTLETVLGDTGAAVALCSLTTVIGYSTLLLSRNHALRSFGVVADIGEIATLVSALIALPVLVRMFRSRRQ
jgi:uncharacterized protein